MRTPIFILSLMTTVLILSGCTESFLDERPQKSLLVPTTVSDMQALLDNASDVMNQGPVLNQFSDGDFIIPDEELDLQSSQVRNSYLWAKQIFNQEASADWDLPYKQILYANIALEGVEKLAGRAASDSQWQQVKGTALFHRAFAMYNLAQQFCAPFDPANAASLPGLPIRLTADVTLSSQRSSVMQTYQRMVTDLSLASELLPSKAQMITRPSKTACQALLARIYLLMQDYSQAESYASAALESNLQLLDYNVIADSPSNPFPVPFGADGNVEILFYTTLNTAINTDPAFLADSGLYRIYEKGDLRKSLFFTPQGNYKGSYTGSFFCFGGLALDELYLITAECLARNGKLQTAMDFLNELRKNRFSKNDYSPLTPTTEEAALLSIFRERRKQLIARGIRWTDLRRLNHDPRFAVKLKRIYRNNIYELNPNDSRYTFPIPNDEIAGSGIAQNPR